MRINWKSACSTHFYSCDLDFDLMALLYVLDLKIMKMYLHAKHELSESSLSKLRAIQIVTPTHTQTNATEHITTTHSRVFKIHTIHPP